LRYEITIEQAGKTPLETAPFASINITEVRFAGRYADGTTGGYSEKLLNNMTFMTPRIFCDHLATESKKIKLDFKIFDPNGRMLTGVDPGYTFSDEITARGNLQQNDIVDVSQWGAETGSVFATTGNYTFEIWCSGVNMFSTSFEVVKAEQIPISPVPTTSYTSDVSVTPDTSPASSVSPVYTASPVSRLKASAGIKAGLNLSTIANGMTDIEFLPEMKLDFHAGILVNLNFGYKENTPGFFGLQTELLYSRQGFTQKGNVVTFNYLTVPLLAKLYLYQGFNLEIGPWFGFLLGVDPNSTEINENIIQISGLKGGKDAGVAVGIGHDFNIGLVVGVRYQHGLSDMANNILWTNRNIAVSLGWKF
jgi:hypothetical protein